MHRRPARSRRRPGPGEGAPRRRFAAPALLTPLLSPCGRVQLERLRGSGGERPPLPGALLSPTQLLGAMERYGSSAVETASAHEEAGGADEERQWLDDALVTGVHACLVRAALADLPAILAVAAKDIPPGTLDALRDSYAARVDGDTWAEGARILLTCVAQHRTATHLAAKYGTEAYEPTAADDSGGNGDAVGNREDVSWVHLHAGRHVLGWVAASSSPKLVGAAPVLPELLLAPAAAAAGGGGGTAAAAAAGASPLAVTKSKGRLTDQHGQAGSGGGGATTSAPVHSPDLLCRAIDAYEYARQVRGQ